MSEYAPGTIVLGDTPDGCDVRLMRLARGQWGSRHGLYYGVEVTNVRPLVVIDPDDAEQVDALCQRYYENPTGKDAPIVCPDCEGEFTLRDMPSVQALIAAMSDQEPTAENGLSRLRLNGYITRPELWALDEACKPLRGTFPDYGPYLVGSVIERSTFRDVDVRLILADEQYDRLTDDEWGLLGFVTSRHLATVTGLPIDFQFQRHTEASAAYGHKTRTPLGLRGDGYWRGDQRPETRPFPPGVTEGDA